MREREGGRAGRPAVAPARSGQGLLVPGLLAPAGLALLLLFPFLRLDVLERLVFTREGLLRGELWRVVTGHWVHLTPLHLFWDGAAFLVLGLLCDRLGRARFVWTLLAAAVAIPLALVVLQPQLCWYAGLSGIDSALFGLLAATLARRSLAARDGAAIALSAALAAAFALKTGYEFAAADAVFVADAGAAPVPLAHAVGFAVGALLGARRLRSAAPAAGPWPRCP